MSYAFKITPREIRKLPVLETGKAAELSERIRRAEDLTLKVRSDWPKFPPDLKDALTNLAYLSVAATPPKRGLLDRLRSVRNSARLTRVFREQPEVVREFLNAVNGLSEAVLEAIERENATYQETLTEAIEEALSDTDRRVMSAEQAREWNRSIFDRAFE